jgi:2-polyprenyl-3-methyl-5-hydroxy-6-metoxy-1,4-benzoquinol methylase
MQDPLVRVLGWRALMLHGDPCVWDRYRWLRARLPRGDGRVLDAGAGNGGFTIFAAKQGHSALGLSFNREEMTAAKRRAELCAAAEARFEIRDLRDLDPDQGLGEQFEAIVCLEVIEHLLDDERLVRGLAASLRSGGRLLLTTPYLRHRPLLNESLSESEDGGHVRWGYDEKRLRELADQASLRVVEVSHVSGVVSQKLTDLQRLLATRGRALGWALTMPLRILQPLDTTLTRLLGYPHLSIAMVAERP